VEIVKSRVKGEQRGQGGGKAGYSKGKGKNLKFLVAKILRGGSRKLKRQFGWLREGNEGLKIKKERLRGESNSDRGKAQRNQRTP